MTLLRNNALWLGAITLFIFGAYYPVIFNEYGFTDDYITITFHKLVGPWDFKTLYTALGRPICSVFTGYAFAPVETISDLSYLRAYSVLWLIISGGAAFLFLRNLKISPECALLVAAAVTLNPAAGVFAGWAITFIYPTSIFLSLLGGWLIIKALQDRLWRQGLGGALCLLCSFFIYQPTALACLVLFSTYYFQPGKALTRPTIIQWSSAIALTSGVMVVYYIAYKAYLPLLEPYGLTTGREGIVTDIGGKLRYFLKDPLWNSIVWWGDFAPKWVGWTIISAIVASLGFLSFHHKKDTGLNGAILLTTLLLSTALLAASPILVPQTNEHQLRVFYSLMGVIGVIPAIAFSLSIAKSSPKFRYITSLTLFVVLGALAHYFVQEGIIKPHTKEVAAYKTHLEENVQTAPELIFLKHPILRPKTLSSIKEWHEYGRYSTWLPWVPYSLINVLLWEQFPELSTGHQETPIIQVYPWQIHEFPPNSVTMDGNFVIIGEPLPPYQAFKRNMLQFLVPNRYEDSLFGTTEILNRSWFYSKSFGFLRKEESGQTLFLKHGTYSVETIDSPYGSILLIDENGQRSITSPDSFPSAYDPETNRRFQLPQKPFPTP